MSLGPIMLDLRGSTLAADERDILKHPQVGGVILFSRNYESIEQLQDLCRAIHELRDPSLLIAVDHEGGRVQRFREGFTHLPPCHLIGECFDRDQAQGLQLAEQAGWLMATELAAVGVDFSFAPVLDLYKGVSQVIGDRAFHAEPETAAVLARRYMQGMSRAGMAAVGKHFPGHGSVKEDSHTEVPVDRRRYEDLAMEDMISFQRLINAGLAAIMPAHVIYPEVDNRPAGFSEIWLKQILRKQLGFRGTIFSDDISMAGAEVAGTFTERTEQALAAGCDMVLICNQQEAATRVIRELKHQPDPAASARLIRMHGRAKTSMDEIRASAEWQQVVDRITSMNITPELNLGDDSS
ncbi:MAG: beta-N-acetylhexosaminidase [Thiotrichales bacterium]|nr:beta-N-acetylhexosaminidase [Thiotrichales bacterium]